MVKVLFMSKYTLEIKPVSLPLLHNSASLTLPLFHFPLAIHLLSIHLSVLSVCLKKSVYLYFFRIVSCIVTEIYSNWLQKTMLFWNGVLPMLLVLLLCRFCPWPLFHGLPFALSDCVYEVHVSAVYLRLFFSTFQLMCTVCVCEHILPASKVFYSYSPLGTKQRAFKQCL